MAKERMNPSLTYSEHPPTGYQMYADGWPDAIILSEKDTRAVAEIYKYAQSVVANNSDPAEQYNILRFGQVDTLLEVSVKYSLL